MCVQAFYTTNTFLLFGPCGLHWPRYVSCYLKLLVVCPYDCSFIELEQLLRQSSMAAHRLAMSTTILTLEIGDCTHGQRHAEHCIEVAREEWPKPAKQPLQWAIPNRGNYCIVEGTSPSIMSERCENVITRVKVDTFLLKSQLNVHLNACHKIHFVQESFVFRVFSFYVFMTCLPNNISVFQIYFEISIDLDRIGTGRDFLL